MAIIDLRPNLGAFTTSFKTAPGAVLLDSLRPNGITWFTVTATILAKAALDETHIAGTITLPSQYAYLLKSIYVTIRLTLGTTNNFAPDGLIDLRLSSPALDTTSHFFPLHNRGISFEVFTAAVAADPTRVYTLETAKVSLVIEGGSTMTLLFADEDAGATNAGTFFAQVAFFRYEREQALASALNTAPPVLLIG